MILEEKIEKIFEILKYDLIKKRIIFIQKIIMNLLV